MHSALDDLESFFWVLVYVAASMKEQRQTTPDSKQILEKLSTDSISDTLSHKCYIVMGLTKGTLSLGEWDRFLRPWAKLVDENLQPMLSLPPGLSLKQHTIEMYNRHIELCLNALDSLSDDSWEGY